jgi:hypothetical protein
MPVGGVEHIRRLRPDVLVVDSAASASGPVPAAMRILTEGWGSRVVALNSQDSTMCVYSGEQRVITGLKDLVEAIWRPGAP